jgi:hypothetical protein
MSSQYMHLVRALAAEHEGGEAESNHVANTHAVRHNTRLARAYRQGVPVTAMFRMTDTAHPTHISEFSQDYWEGADPHHNTNNMGSE